MARIYREVAVGETVQIEMESGHVLAGSVVWERDYVPHLASRRVHDVGIQFQETTDVKSVLASESATETRALPRLPRIEIAPYVRLAVGGHYLSGQLCDISQGDAKVQTTRPVPEVGSVSLMLRDFPALPGSVCWIRGTKIGISFNERSKLVPLMQWIHDRRAEPCARPAPEETVVPGLADHKPMKEHNLHG